MSHTLGVRWCAFSVAVLFFTVLGAHCPVVSAEVDDAVRQRRAAALTATANRGGLEHLPLEPGRQTRLERAKKIILRPCTVCGHAVTEARRAVLACRRRCAEAQSALRRLLNPMTQPKSSLPAASCGCFDPGSGYITACCLYTYIFISVRR